METGTIVMLIVIIGLFAATIGMIAMNMKNESASQSEATEETT